MKAQPVAGNWQVPTVRVASNGYDWPHERADAHGIDYTALIQVLADGADLANVLSLLVVRDGDGLWAIDTASTNGTEYDREMVRYLRLDADTELRLANRITLQWQARMVGRA